jgi:hypothetical protein
VQWKLTNDEDVAKNWKSTFRVHDGHGTSVSQTLGCTVEVDTCRLAINNETAAAIDKCKDEHDYIEVCRLVKKFAALGEDPYAWRSVQNFCWGKDLEEGFPGYVKESEIQENKEVAIGDSACAGDYLHHTQSYDFRARAQHPTVNGKTSKWSRTVRVPTATPEHLLPEPHKNSFCVSTGHCHRTSTGSFAVNDDKQQWLVMDPRSYEMSNFSSTLTSTYGNSPEEGFRDNAYAGGGFHLDQFREFVNAHHDLALTTVATRGGDAWAFIMSHVPHFKSQGILPSPVLRSESWMRSKLKRDAYFTQVAGSSLYHAELQWAFVTSKGTGYTDQQFRVESAPQFPVQWAKDTIAQGEYLITDIGASSDSWLIVSSSNVCESSELYQVTCDQIVLTSNTTFPTEELEINYNNGFRITSAANRDGVWALVLTKNAGYGQQLWTMSEEFPDDWIRSNTKKTGMTYAVTAIAGSETHWFVVLSKAVNFGQNACLRDCNIANPRYTSDGILIEEHVRKDDTCECSCNSGWRPKKAVVTASTKFVNWPNWDLHESAWTAADGKWATFAERGVAPEQRVEVGCHLRPVDCEFGEFGELSQCFGRPDVITKKIKKEVATCGNGYHYKFRQIIKTDKSNEQDLVDMDGVSVRNKFLADVRDQQLTTFFSKRVGKDLPLPYGFPCAVSGCLDRCKNCKKYKVEACEFKCKRDDCDSAINKCEIECDKTAGSLSHLCKADCRQNSWKLPYEERSRGCFESHCVDKCAAAGDDTCPSQENIDHGFCEVTSSSFGNCHEQWDLDSTAEMYATMETCALRRCPGLPVPIPEVRREGGSASQCILYTDYIDLEGSRNRENTEGGVTLVASPAECTASQVALFKCKECIETENVGNDGNFTSMCNITERAWVYDKALTGNNKIGPAGHRNNVLRKNGKECDIYEGIQDPIPVKVLGKIPLVNSPYNEMELLSGDSYDYRLVDGVLEPYRVSKKSHSFEWFIDHKMSRDLSADTLELLSKCTQPCTEGMSDGWLQMKDSVGALPSLTKPFSERTSIIFGGEGVHYGTYRILLRLTRREIISCNSMSLDEDGVPDCEYSNTTLLHNESSLGEMLVTSDNCAAPRVSIVYPVRQNASSLCKRDRFDFRLADRDGNGVLSEVEYAIDPVRAPKHTGNNFDILDVNGDENLSPAEYTVAHHTKFCSGDLAKERMNPSKFIHIKARVASRNEERPTLTGKFNKTKQNLITIGDSPHNSFGMWRPDFVTNENGVAIYNGMDKIPYKESFAMPYEQTVENIVQTQCCRCHNDTIERPRCVLGREACEASYGVFTVSECIGALDSFYVNKDPKRGYDEVECVLSGGSYVPSMCTDYEFHLSILPNKISESGLYTFRVKTFDLCARGRNDIYDDITMYVNNPPYNGYLDINPRQGVTLKDTFRLVVGGWLDQEKDYPLQVMFKYIVETADQFGNAVSSCNVMLEPGTPNACPEIPLSTGAKLGMYIANGTYANANGTMEWRNDKLAYMGNMSGVFPIGAITLVAYISDNVDATARHIHSRDHEVVNISVIEPAFNDSSAKVDFLGEQTAGFNSESGADDVSQTVNAVVKLMNDQKALLVDITHEALCNASCHNHGICAQMNPPNCILADDDGNILHGCKVVSCYCEIGFQGNLCELLDGAMLAQKQEIRDQLVGGLGIIGDSSNGTEASEAQAKSLSEITASPGELSGNAVGGSLDVVNGILGGTSDEIDVTSQGGPLLGSMSNLAGTSGPNGTTDASGMVGDLLAGMTSGSQGAMGVAVTSAKIQVAAQQKTMEAMRSFRYYVPPNDNCTIGPWIQFPQHFLNTELDLKVQGQQWGMNRHKNDSAPAAVNMTRDMVEVDVNITNVTAIPEPTDVTGIAIGAKVKNQPYPHVVWFTMPLKVASYQINNESVGTDGLRSAQCQYWSEEQQAWSKEGAFAVGLIQTESPCGYTITSLLCASTHLTEFSETKQSDLPQTNTIDPMDPAALGALFDPSNLLTLFALSSMLITFFVSLVYAIRGDKRDFKIYKAFMQCEFLKKGVLDGEVPENPVWWRFAYQTFRANSTFFSFLNPPLTHAVIFKRPERVVCTFAYVLSSLAVTAVFLPNLCDNDNTEEQAASRKVNTMVAKGVMTFLMLLPSSTIFPMAFMKINSLVSRTWRKDEEILKYSDVEEFMDERVSPGLIFGAMDPEMRKEYTQAKKAGKTGDDLKAVMHAEADIGHDTQGLLPEMEVDDAIKTLAEIEDIVENPVLVEKNQEVFTFTRAQAEKRRWLLVMRRMEFEVFMGFTRQRSTQLRAMYTWISVYITFAVYMNLLYGIKFTPCYQIKWFLAAGQTLLKMAIVSEPISITITVVLLSKLNKLYGLMEQDTDVRDKTLDAAILLQTTWRAKKERAKFKAIMGDARGAKVAFEEKKKADKAAWMGRNQHKIDSAVDIQRFIRGCWGRERAARKRKVRKMQIASERRERRALILQQAKKQSLMASKMSLAQKQQAEMRRKMEAEAYRLKLEAEKAEARQFLLDRVNEGKDIAKNNSAMVSDWNSKQSTRKGGKKGRKGRKKR